MKLILRHLDDHSVPNDINSPAAQSVDSQKTLDGRLLALDPGEKRVGVAVSDEMHLTVRPLETIQRTSWKKLLFDIKELLREFDAKALVIGLPVSLDGIERSAAIEIRGLVQKLSKSIDVPLFLQDERLTSQTAEDSLREAGYGSSDVKRLVDSEAAAIILRDFISELPRTTEANSQEMEKGPTI